MDYENMTFKVEFKNKELEKLWIYLSNHCMFVSADAANAFMKCDEELTDIQDQCEHWKVMYANACGDQDVFKESIRLQDIAYRKLEQKVRDQEKEIEKRRKEAYGLYKELDRLRDEKGSLSYQKIRDQEKEINQLREENERLQGLNLDIIAENNDLRNDNESLELVIKRNIDDATVDKNAIHQLRKENEALASAVNSKDDELQDLQKQCDELKKDCEYMTNSRNAWRTRAKHEEEWYRKHYKEQFDKIQELKNKLAVPDPKADTKEEHTITITMGETNYKILLNILSSKAFGASPEYMRDSLKEFCGERYFCKGCPLRFSDCDFDNMSDEEIETHYKMAIGAQSYTEKPDLIFGDIVKVPWSDDDYIFIETLTSAIRLYNVPKKKFVNVSKSEHLKWVGHIKK